jgi:hypothetical protein
MVLLYRPYDVVDFIETNALLRKVGKTSPVNTTVLTIDNQTLVLPNSKIWGDVIKMSPPGTSGGSTSFSASGTPPTIENSHIEV